MLRRNLQRIFTCGQKQERGLQDQGQQVQEQQDKLVETVLEAFEKFHDFKRLIKHYPWFKIQHTRGNPFKQ